MFERGDQEAAEGRPPHRHRPGSPDGDAIPADAVRGLAEVSGSTTVHGFAEVAGFAEVGGSATVDGLAEPGDLGDGGAEPGGFGDDGDVSRIDGSAQLAVRVAALELARLDDHDLVEAVAAFERVVSWARARSAAAAAELAGRRSMNPTWPPCAGRVAEPCVAATELSLRLGVSRQAAGRLVETGKALTGPQQQTGAALERGDIDWGKAQAMVDALAEVPLVVSLEVEATVLPIAPRRTHAQLRRDVQHALVALDPRDAAERHDRARERRHVSRPMVLPDGMARMTAVLPADAALRLDATLHAAAIAAHHDGDGRTTDQLRADALDAMAGAAWASGSIGSCATCSGSGSTQGAAATGPGGSGSARLATGGGRRAQIQVTVGIGTLLGLDDRPAELAGYGSIGADVARRIAADGTWRRLLVDEPTGTVVDVGRRRYRPPADMAELVRCRNRTCVVPTCSVSAERCDLDHTEPFGPLAADAPAGGHTAVDNLGPLCSTHHLQKTHGGFRLHQTDAGSFVVRTPTGHRYDQPPDRPPGVPGGGTSAGRWMPARGRPVSTSEEDAPPF